MCVWQLFSLRVLGSDDSPSLVAEAKIRAQLLKVVASLASFNSGCITTRFFTCCWFFNVYISASFSTIYPIFSSDSTILDDRLHAYLAGIFAHQQGAVPPSSDYFGAFPAYTSAIFSSCRPNMAPAVRASGKIDLRFIFTSVVPIKQVILTLTAFYCLARIIPGLGIKKWLKAGMSRQGVSVSSIAYGPEGWTILPESRTCHNKNHHF